MKKIAIESRLVLTALKVTFVRLVGAMSVLTLQMMVGNAIGAHGAGLFYVLWMLVTVLSTVACLGMDHGVVRCTSIYCSRNDWSGLSDHLKTYLTIATAAGLTLTLAFAATAESFSNNISENSGAAELIIMISPVVLLMTIAALLAGALNGLNLNNSSVAMQQALPFTVAIIFLLYRGPAFVLRDVVNGLLLGWLFSFLFGLLVFGFWLKKHTPNPVPRSTPVDVGLANLFVFQLLVLIYTWSGVATVKYSLTLSDVGVFGAAQRLVMVISFLLSSIAIITRPKFAALHAAGDMEGINRVVQQTTAVMVWVSVPLFVVLSLFSVNIMNLFGVDFSRGWFVLIILGGGQLVSAILGSVGHILNMTGHSKDMRQIMLYGVPVSILLIYALSERYGLIGAALGGSLGMALVNTLIAVQVKRRLGVVVWRGSFLTWRSRDQSA